MNRPIRFLVAILPVIFLVSCSPVRKLEPGAVLLNKNVVKADQRKMRDDLKAILKQKPNRKILYLFRFHLGVYTLFNRGKDTRFKRWVKNTIGEAPVLLDTALTAKSRTQIKQFMLNNGYFNASVSDTTVIRRNRKATVTYTVRSNEPYRIRRLEYQVEDSTIDAIVRHDAPQCLIRPSDVFNTQVLQQERERLTTLIRNHGYFFFTQQFIAYKIDSALKANEVLVYLQVVNPQSRLDTGSVRSGRHRPYSIGHVFVQPDFSPNDSLTGLFRDSALVDGREYRFHGLPRNFRPRVLSRHIFIHPDTVYNVTDHDNTYEYLSELGNFRFVNINFRVDSSLLAQGKRSLNANIQLTPNLRQSYRIEVEGTHNGGNLGVAGNFIYANRNIFKGAELFELKLKASLEDQKNFSGLEEKLFIFNTYEFGPEARITIPLRGAKREFFAAASYNLQNRPEFRRRVVTFSGGYTFRRSKNVTVLLNPVELNFVTVKRDPAFQEILDKIDDPGLSDSYDDHLIPAGVYSFILNTQNLKRPRSFFYFRFNFETAGLMVRTTQWALGKIDTKDSSYSVLNNVYSQYLRPEADFRYYHVLDEHNTVVYRLAGGVGIPYRNSSDLPFEKNFFAGGANDLRAFIARSLGPGSYNDPLDVQQSGEIKINANIEYRFDIFRILEGAFFADAGNIWLLKEDDKRPGGRFAFDRFPGEMAIGGGFGIRFNFNYFVVRYDIGFPFRDPRLVPDERWVYKDLKLRDATSNIGIGYPF